MSAVGDARKRHAEQHHTHPDPATRELIARAEARGAERERARIAQAIAESVSYNFELRPDGTEDPQAAAYSEGLRNAWDIARTAPTATVERAW